MSKELQWLVSFWNLIQEANTSPEARASVREVKTQMDRLKPINSPLESVLFD